MRLFLALEALCLPRASRWRHRDCAACVLSGLALLSAANPAAAGVGDLKGTKPGDLQFPGFDDADTCNLCHGGGYKGDKTFLPSDTWPGTMMGNAARDPVFFAALTVANQDAPGIGTYCLRCHSPIAFVKGHATPPDGSAFDATDNQGVGCDTCHRALPSPTPDAPYLLSDAQLVYSENLSKHGPYEDTDSPAHPASVEDPLLAEPRFCGQCHEVTNPEVRLLDASGKDTGLEFPLDTTFTEWSASALGKKGSADYKGCQDCHMPPKAGAHPVTRLAGSPTRNDPPVHTFVGGNHWGIKAVMQKNPDRAAKYPNAFNLALQNTLDNLAQSVKVTWTKAPPAGAPGGPLQVTIRVENLTGHKFPAGYAESRRAWIGVSLIDASGSEQALLGGFDLGTGEIQASPATHVYRAQHGRWDKAAGAGKAEEHIALHDMVIADTRIPPKGFVAGKTTTPSGDVDFGDGSGGYRSFDEATFTLTAPEGAAGDLTLSARVYYQSMTREHIEFLKTANTTDQKGEELERIFKATGEGAPLLIAHADTTVSFPKAPGPTGTGAGGAGGAGGTGAGGAGSSGGGGSSGCGCRTAPDENPSWGTVMGVLGLAALAGRRRGRRT